MNRRTFRKLKIFQYGAKDSRIQREVLEKDVAFFLANGWRNLPFADRTNFAILRLTGQLVILNFFRFSGFRWLNGFSYFYYCFSCFSYFYYSFSRFRRFYGFHCISRFRRFCRFSLGGLLRLFRWLALNRCRRLISATDFLQPRQKLRYES